MFKGIQKVSLVDFPGILASTLFTGGCNFNCGWCHNRLLVDPLQLAAIEDIEEKTIKSFLLNRKSKIEGVCITGGEPTIWGNELLSFIRWLKHEGYLVKLDTNGYLPDVLSLFIQSRQLDYIAMDIKNIFGEYSKSCGIPDINTDLINESIMMIKASGIKYQFRTTMVLGLVKPDRIKSFYRKIGEPFLAQEYRDTGLQL